MSELEKLAERVEQAMIHSAKEAISLPIGTSMRVAHRDAAAKWAIIAQGLRARAKEASHGAPDRLDPDMGD